MFDQVATCGPFKERLTRYFGRQLLDVLHYMNTRGVANRDLKLENLMIDENFDLNMVDFGFACSIQGK